MTASTSSHGPVELVHTWFRGDLYRWDAELSYRWGDDDVLAISVHDDVDVSGHKPTFHDPGTDRPRP